jgi:hypothetical protein
MGQRSGDDADDRDGPLVSRPDASSVFDEILSSLPDATTAKISLRRNHDARKITSAPTGAEPVGGRRAEIGKPLVLSPPFCQEL